MNIFPKIIGFLERGLDGAALRHRVIADNIANGETAGFKRSDVDFISTLQAALEKRGDGVDLRVTNPRHLQAGAGDFFEVVTDTTTAIKKDGNNVDVEREMTLLAENALYYNAVADETARLLALLRNAINEGRR
ncbi:MAG: flagellar basal body rod protein FlgB [Firmicutes bacterium]|nr:flagellar basal body rod protein FlgB [Bacillota bacterium]MCL5039250.1 flagellar basal body rod protein FlgB [Bacillota bacterium]